jgi:hypothetical protein
MIVTYIGDISNPAPCLSPFCLPDHIEMPRSASLYPKKANYRPWWALPLMLGWFGSPKRDLHEILTPDQTAFEDRGHLGDRLFVDSRNFDARRMTISLDDIILYH